VARLLQEMQLQQQQQQQQQGTWKWQWAINSNSSSSSSGSMFAAGMVHKRQLLQPALVWTPQELQAKQQQQQQQQQQGGRRLWADTSAAAAATPQQQQQQQEETEFFPPLVLEVAIAGAALPSDPEDWQQLQGLASLEKLLLPAAKPCLLPCMVSSSSSSSSGGGGGGGFPAKNSGVVCLRQLRALQLSVEAGYSAPHMAHVWGLGVGEQGSGPPACIQGLSTLTRLTHLSLHSNGASTREMTSSLVTLTHLRELLLSGSSVVHLPFLATRLTNLQLLVLQQQVSSLGFTGCLVWFGFNGPDQGS
jgi:hypothetical protein